MTATPALETGWAPQTPHEREAAQGHPIPAEPVPVAGPLREQLERHILIQKDPRRRRPRRAFPAAGDW